MSIMGYYKRLQRIEKLCYKSNLKLVKKQEQQINKLATCIEQIKEIAEKIDDSDGCAYGDYDCDNCSSLEQETVCTYKVKKLILQKISEVDIE